MPYASFSPSPKRSNSSPSSCTLNVTPNADDACTCRCSSKKTPHTPARPWASIWPQVEPHSLPAQPLCHGQPPGTAFDQATRPGPGQRTVPEAVYVAIAQRLRQREGFFPATRNASRGSTRSSGSRCSPRGSTTWYALARGGPAESLPAGASEKGLAARRRLLRVLGVVFKVWRPLLQILRKMVLAARATAGG